ncbi:MAG: ABC transporter permease [Planctomycetota bacterium]|nr:ABC transporter permease [Planctomycetota bacterium]
MTAPVAEKGTSLWADAWRRLRRNHFAIAGTLMLGLVILTCFMGPWLMELLGHDLERTYPERANLPPSFSDWFGTDELGRSYLGRVLIGGQMSLLIGLVATVTSVVLGVCYGAIAGYYGGKLDEVLMRLVDFLYGIPYMFLVILIMLMFSDAARDSPLPIFFALGMVQWLTTARIVRGQVLTLRHQEFVLAARVLGAGDMRIIFRHILPNTLGVVVVYATLTVPAVILLESFLAFLGLGAGVTWGLLVSEGLSVVNPVQSYWWRLLFPSIFLALTLFSLNFMGDGLRDALDPRTRR